LGDGSKSDFSKPFFGGNLVRGFVITGLSGAGILFGLRFKGLYLAGPKEEKDGGKAFDLLMDLGLEEDLERTDEKIGGISLRFFLLTLVVVSFGIFKFSSFCSSKANLSSFSICFFTLDSYASIPGFSVLVIGIAAELICPIRSL